MEGQIKVLSAWPCLSKQSKQTCLRSTHQNTFDGISLIHSFKFGDFKFYKGINIYYLCLAQQKTKAQRLADLLKAGGFTCRF